MILKVKFELKKYNRNFSDQIINEIINGVSVSLKIKEETCASVFSGEDSENVKKIFYAVWELLALYDGYFYKPISYKKDGIEKSVEELIIVPFYVSDKKWINAADLLGRNKRDLSENIVNRYLEFRNMGRADKKMITTLINSFYMIHSEAYKGINHEHRLSLLLNMCDGYYINIVKNRRDNKANIQWVLKKTLNTNKIMYGLKLLNIPEEKIYFMLGEGRNELDHYLYTEDSMRAYAVATSEDAEKHLEWYCIFVIEIALRIGFLKEIGVILDDEIKEYALNSIIDWMILSCGLSERCILDENKAKQDLTKMIKDIQAIQV